MSDQKEAVKLSVTVQKPTPYTFDLGLLLANDPNPLLLQGDLEDDLSATARDGAQALLNQLLSTCPISSTSSGVLLSLPPISTPLPREKVTCPIPLPYSPALFPCPSVPCSFLIPHPRALQANGPRPHLTAPTASQDRNHVGTIRAQEGHQSQDGGRATEDAVRRGDRRVDAEMGV
jgi:hypothetical protein